MAQINALMPSDAQEPEPHHDARRTNIGGADHDDVLDANG